MADPLDITSLATHSVAAVGGAGGIGALMRWLAGREAQEMTTRLALIEQKLDQLVDVGRKHEAYGERLALVEAKALRAHERADELRDQLAELKGRRK